jgi:hypothetical protein
MKVSSFQPMQGYEGAKRAAAQKPADLPQRGSGMPTTDIISKEELQYFATLYPDQSKEFSSYSTYSKDGISQGHSVGSLIDTKS